MAKNALQSRQNELRGFRGLHGAKRVARGDYMGGYTHYVVTDDGALLCPACVRENWREIVSAYRDKRNDGWRPVAITTSGDFEEFESCAHCNATLYNPED